MVFQFFGILLMEVIDFSGGGVGSNLKGQRGVCVSTPKALNPVENHECGDILYSLSLFYSYV